MGVFERLVVNANTFLLPNTSEREFRFHLQKLDPEGVIGYFQGLGLEKQQDIWSFIKTVLKVLGGLVAIGNGILLIAEMA